VSRTCCGTSERLFTNGLRAGGAAPALINPITGIVIGCCARAATDEARVLREAINVAKQPTVISGADLRDADDAAQAMDQLREIGRRMAPTATAEKQFAVAFEDPKNVALVLRVHQRPSATTSFPFPARR